MVSPHSEAANGCREWRVPAWRKGFIATIGRVRTYLIRWRERQELLEYIASDHRAAADLGINMDTARDWSRRPFWRA